MVLPFSPPPPDASPYRGRRQTLILACQARPGVFHSHNKLYKYTLALVLVNLLETSLPPHRCCYCCWPVDGEIGSTGFYPFLVSRSLYVLRAVVPVRTRRSSKIATSFLQQIEELYSYQ